MRFAWRGTLGALLLIAPALAAALWSPSVRPAATPAPAHHGDHSPAPVAQGSSGETPVPEGAGASGWDHALPAWPEGGRIFEVGPGRQYKTLGSALFLARDGDRVVVYPGQYHGGALLKYRVWLDARPGADLMGHEGTVVTITAPGARLTGLRLWHSGDSFNSEDAGVTVLDAPGAVVAGCSISDALFGVVVKNAQGALVAGNTISGRPGDLALAGDGIRVWYSDGARVVANTVRRSREIIVESTLGAEVRGNAVVDSRQGLHLMNAPRATVVGNFMSNNSTGIYVMYGADTVVDSNRLENHRGPSGYGIGLKEADGARVRGNLLVGNRVGLYVENSPRDPERWNELQQNRLIRNDIGLSLTTATTANRISTNEFVENLQQVAATGQGRMGANAWTIAGVGNFWSDYEGYDADGDRVGDLPHSPVRLFEGWMDRKPELRWFWFAPATAVVDAAARAFPMAAPEPLLVDEKPAMMPFERGEGRD